MGGLDIGYWDSNRGILSKNRFYEGIRSESKPPGPKPPIYY